MAAQFVDIGFLHEEKHFIYPLERVAVVPGKDIIYGRGDGCDVKILPVVLEQALIKSFERTRYGGEESAASQEPPRTDDSELEKTAISYLRCSREHFEYSIPRRSIKDLDSTNGTFLARAIRNSKDNPTGEYGEKERLSPRKFVEIKDGDIVYAGPIILRFEDPKD